MKHIFIIGSRGYHAKYGGWETFVSNLVDNYKDDNTIFHISSLSDKDETEYKVNDNVIIKPFNIKYNGGVKMALCTIRALNYYLKYIEKNSIKNANLYVLGLKLGPLLMLKKNKIKKLGIKVFVNPDGLEHERSKWSYPVKKYFLLSEKWMLNNCDVIVCDAKGIKKYVEEKYPNLKNKTVYIAYGTKEIDLSNVNESEILKEFNLIKDDYCLMVGRFVPENNYELVIKEFMNSKIDKKLVIVSNLSSSSYYNEVVEKTNCNKDNRIIFIDGIYDEIKLSTVRKNAYLYIHGHSVGGTNPSLLEALSLTNLNILYNVNFNKDIGKNACLYFDKKCSLKKILDNIEKYDSKKMGKVCKKIIKDNFTWDIIINKYKKIFNG